MRMALGLNQTRLAAILGCSSAYLCRQEKRETVSWERATLGASLLVYLDMRTRMEDSRALGKALEEAVLTGGTLRALAVLLAPLRA